jgi:NAD(P)-dependent dehydrogenase (short-subunit alcohol dehydrogenase family)
LSLSESEIKSIVDKAAAVHGRIDVLVNNAGMGIAGFFEELR